MYICNMEEKTYYWKINKLVKNVSSATKAFKAYNSHPYVRIAFTTIRT